MEQLSNLIIKRKKTAQASLIRNAEQSFFFLKEKRTKRKDGWVGNLKNKQKKMNVIVKDKVKKKRLEIR